MCRHACASITLPTQPCHTLRHGCCCYIIHITRHYYRHYMRYAHSHRYWGLYVVACPRYASGEPPLQPVTIRALRASATPICAGAPPVVTPRSACHSLIRCAPPGSRLALRYGVAADILHTYYEISWRSRRGRSARGYNEPGRREEGDISATLR